MLVYINDLVQVGDVEVDPGHDLLPGVQRGLVPGLPAGPLLLRPEPDHQAAGVAGRGGPHTLHWLERQHWPGSGTCKAHLQLVANFGSIPPTLHHIDSTLVFLIPCGPICACEDIF